MLLFFARGFELGNNVVQRLIPIGMQLEEVGMTFDGKRQLHGASEALVSLQLAEPRFVVAFFLACEIGLFQAIERIVDLI